MLVGAAYRGSSTSALGQSCHRTFSNQGPRRVGLSHCANGRFGEAPRMTGYGAFKPCVGSYLATPVASAKDTRS